MISTFDEVQHITTEDLQSILDENPTIIDVREVYEFEDAHIPSSINIPLQELDSYVGSRKRLSLDKDETLYIVCAHGNRSIRASAYLSSKGLHAINVVGGMSLWNGEVEK